MYKGLGGLVGALALTLLCVTTALAQDYVVPVIVGGKTYTLTVTVSGSAVKVASNVPEVKVGTVHPVPKVADTAAAAQSAPDAQAQMAAAVTIEYDDLFRNNEQHVGKMVRYVGKVLQYGELTCLFCDDPGHYLRVGTTNKGYGVYDDPIYVLYAGDQRFLEDDIVTVWGTVDGLESYTALLGNEVTIPRIKALDVVLGEVSNPKVAGKPGQPAANRDANLRGGPGTDYSVVGSVDTGQGLTITARNADNSWFQLEGGAWIAAFLVDNAPAAAAVPLAQDLPEPAPAAPAADTAETNTANTAAPSAQAPAAAAPAGSSAGDSSIVPIGQEVEAGGWRFKVAEVHKRKAVYFYDDPYVAMGHFLIVIIEATNLQSGTDYLDRNLDPWLTDDAGSVYGPSGSGSSRAQWQYGGLTSPYENVNPGNFARVAIAYDMPDSVGHVLLSTDAGKWIDLGDFSALPSEDN